MRIIACGGRDYVDYATVAETMGAYLPLGGGLLVAQGGAKGADSLVHRWCSRNRIACATFLADWDAHPRAAGPIRNKDMLATVEPDLVIAFPGGRGTAHMASIAEKAGVQVIRITE